MADDCEDTGAMRRIYKIGIVHGHVAKNPLMHIETRSKSDYKAIVITPAQTLAILHSLPSPLHFTLVLTCSATGAARLRDAVAALGRRALGGRAHTDLQALGEG